MAVSCRVGVTANRRSLIMGIACQSLLGALSWTLHALYFLVRSSTLQDGMYYCTYVVVLCNISWYGVVYFFVRSSTF